MKHKRLLIDATLYTLTGYIIQPLSIACSLFVKNSIGPYLVGVMATLNLFLYYVSFAHLGILNAAERDLPFCLGKEDNERFERIQATTFTVMLVSGVVCFSVIVGWAIWYRSTMDRFLFVGTLVYSVYIVLWYLSAYYMTLLRSYQEFVYLSKIQIAIGVFSGIGNVVAVVLFGFWGLLCMTLFTITVQVGFLAIHARSSYRLQINWVELGKLLSVGIPLVIFGLAMTGIRTVDQVLVLRILGTEKLGIYSIAMMSGAAVFQATNSLGGVLYPRMQKAYGENMAIESLARYVIRPSIIMGIILPFMIGGLFFFVPPVVTWLLPQFSAGIMSVKIVSISTFFFAMFSNSSNFLITLNKQLKASILLAIGSVLSFILGWIFVHIGWGLVGVALATGIGYIFCFVTINAYAMSHWMTFREISAFLMNICIPIAYAAVLLILLDYYLIPVQASLLSAFGCALGAFLVFCLAYLPLVLWMEPQSGLISDFVRPVLRRFLSSRSDL